jgi:hypothetical protein
MGFVCARGEGLWKNMSLSDDISDYIGHVGVVIAGLAL